MGELVGAGEWELVEVGIGFGGVVFGHYSYALFAFVQESPISPPRCHCNWYTTQCFNWCEVLPKKCFKVLKGQEIFQESANIEKTEVLLHWQEYFELWTSYWWGGMSLKIVSFRILLNCHWNISLTDTSLHRVCDCNCVISSYTYPLTNSSFWRLKSENKHWQRCLDISQFSTLNSHIQSSKKERKREKGKRLQNFF